MPAVLWPTVLLKEREFSGGTNENIDEDRLNNLAYIYQDMRTAIVGKFLRGKLLEGDHRRIIGYRYAIPIGIVIHESFLKLF